MKKRTKNAGIVIVVAVLLIGITIMNTLLVFRMTQNQTRDSGVYRLSGISGELRSTINEAEKYTMELALRAREYISDIDALRVFIYERKEEIDKGTRGCFNLYIAGKGWHIIPGFEGRDEDFDATERDWYKGAVRSAGSVYLTSPYIDVVTGDICYTASVVMGDGETVLGVDYNIDNIRQQISGLFGDSPENAVVVTQDGLIAGCRDESKIGSKLTDVLPEYAGIFSLAKSSDEMVTLRIKADRMYENLFALDVGSGWYLIVSENDWEMYGSAYIQMIFNLVMSLALMGVVIVLYLLVLRNEMKAETALASKDEFLQGITGKLAEPLKRILESSSSEIVAQSDNYEAEFARIHASGEQLSEMIGQIISYSNIVKTEKKKEDREKKIMSGGVTRRFRSMIVLFMVAVMAVSVYSNISAAYQWGRGEMANKVSSYEYPLSEWIDTNKSILDMFCSIVSTNPQMLGDYEGTIKYLNDVTTQYPNISISYMTNPDLEPSVYMNNGWKPPEGWKVEERPWYIGAMNSKNGWSISAPYSDDRTGQYCVTFSKVVLDAVNSEFLGVFGIDFFIDELVGILGKSYSDEGYAFLVDAEGNIINHPYGNYQMSPDNTPNVADSPYGWIVTDGKTTKLFVDYDNSYKVLIALRNEESGFTIYCVRSFWSIYGKVVLYGLAGFFTFLACIILVYRLLTSMMHKQEEYSRNIEKAADAAIAAGKAKSQFLAQMSHEIRTPINAVLGMNEMILRESDENNILEYSGNIQSAGRTLLSLINSILDFSKIEDGKMEIIPVKYETAALVAGLVNSIYERAKDKGLKFVAEIDENLPKTLLGDDMRLSQIVMNLLTNAVKYTEYGSVTLRIRDDGREGEAVILDVEVEDTGIGIRKEDIPKMFESFERLEEKRNRNIEGTGLGMSIVTKLLEMMDSRLEVESVYGEGSKFSFKIRQQIVDQTPMGRYSDRIEEMYKNDADEKYLYTVGARVLVVDDNSMNLMVARNLLKLCNIVPDMVKSGYEAIETLKSHQYDVIFLDHMMPRLDGIETLKIIREQKLAGNAKIVALTANAVAGVREEYLAAGFDDYLPKPIDLHKLEDQLMKYLPEGSAQYRAKRRKHGKPAAQAAQQADDKTTLHAVNAGHTELADDEYLEFMPEEEKETDTSFEFAAEEDKKTDTSPGKYQKAAPLLDEAGINRTEGYLYCGEDEDLYVGIMLEYAGYGRKYREDLEKFLAEENMPEYAVIVHAIKSTSKTIGAKDLSEEAKALELAAKAGDTDFVKANHEAFVTKYTVLTELLLRELK